MLGVMRGVHGRLAGVHTLSQSVAQICQKIVYDETRFLQLVRQRQTLLHTLSARYLSPVSIVRACPVNTGEKQVVF
jgi:hypothetical protein